jgi:hypothetical protein
MDSDAVDVFLEHHGIKGQKWGVRRNREVSADKQAHREAKAQKYVRRSAEAQTKINELRAKPKQTYIQRHFTEGDRNLKISELENVRNRADAAAEAKRQGKLTKEQKEVLIGAGVVAALVGTAIVTQKINSGEARVLMNRGQEILTGKKFEFTKAPELKGNWDADSINSLVAKEINTGYPHELGSGMNCRRCTYAYEMRRRGYDVVATRTPTASGQNAMGVFNAITTDHKDISTRKGIKLLSKDVIRDPSQTTFSSDPLTRHLQAITRRGNSLRSFKAPDDIFSRLALEPERSRGELTVKWAGGGGHSMAYEIINGIPHVFDTQTGNYYASQQMFEQKMPDMAQAGFTRLDNIPLDSHFLQRWMKNAK